MSDKAARVFSRNASDGYRALMGEVRASDLGDPWGTALGWLGAIADVIYLRCGDIMPDYEPSSLLCSVADIEDDYPSSDVLDMLDDGTVTEDDLRAVYGIVNRYADWARLAGRDY